jgi:diguanylate cyclase (GGDEF)-like protein
MPEWHFSKPRIPTRAVIVSIVALAVPFLDTALSAPESDPMGAELWLLALVPAFLLAYYRGWQGAATALAAGMTVLTIATCILFYRGARLDGDLFLPVVAACIAITLAIGWLSDRLHADRANAELMALMDDLTKMPNRRRARMFLESLVAREPSPNVCVVLFDLDNFKAYNDRYGHPAGDRLICAFADVLTDAAGVDDLPARYGGEEFLVVLSACDERSALDFAERVRIALRDAQTSEEPITVSAGVAYHGGRYANANALIIAADQALYSAKQQGRDRACLATLPVTPSG